jgi:DNA-binding HxlR family transcriptional regulator
MPPHLLVIALAQKIAGCLQNASSGPSLVDVRTLTRRSTCPISSALDIFGDKWSLLVMRDLLFREKRHYREFHASEEGVATNILADRLERLESAGLIRKTGGDPRSGKQSYVATPKGKDLIPVLLEMMLWSAKYFHETGTPQELLAELKKDKTRVAREVRRLGGVEAFLKSR